MCAVTEGLIDKVLKFARHAFVKILDLLCREIPLGTARDGIP
jgi:hypothetical protein